MIERWKEKKDVTLTLYIQITCQYSLRTKKQAEQRQKCSESFRTKQFEYNL